MSIELCDHVNIQLVIFSPFKLLSFTSVHKNELGPNQSPPTTDPFIQLSSIEWLKLHSMGATNSSSR